MPLAYMNKNMVRYFTYFSYIYYHKKIRILIPKISTAPIFVSQGETLKVQMWRGWWCHGIHESRPFIKIPAYGANLVHDTINLLFLYKVRKFG
jgi:hypothetical protein